MPWLLTRMYAVFVCVGVFAFANGYVNIALYKPAYQHNAEAGDTFNASNAVDGRKSNLSVDGGQCAVSYWGKKTATWWVNLYSIHSIHHITIFFMTNNQPWDKLQGTLCDKDDNFTRATIPAVFTTTCPVHGQYVIYYNERRQGVTYPDDYSKYVFTGLCEVEVHGCPATGYFGFNCSVPCPDVNCQYCHIETGTCQGCKPGYQGHRCELACDRGLYGFKCNKTCGQCRGLNQCSNINGTCFTGCDAGYQGDLCKTSCDRGLYGSECNETCGHCRDLNQCSNINGTCLTGCAAGYQGNLCKSPCDRGLYGSECNERCGHCRDVNQCSNINGTCVTGCDAGFQGSLCKTYMPSSISIESGSISTDTHVNRITIIEE
uniref:Scavenger receptor class F member 2 n=1 Tax=Magallana gigas TaxID=29159 RepID=K1QLN4_MAGGI